jgi:hypothetical protein
MGWWQCTPQGSNQSRTANLEAFDLPELPATETAHLVWAELGHCLPGQHGPVPLSWAEIQAFAQMTQADRSPEFWRTIHAMSLAYVGALTDRNPLSIMPMERNRDD